MMQSDNVEQLQPNTLVSEANSAANETVNEAVNNNAEANKMSADMDDIDNEMPVENSEDLRLSEANNAVKNHVIASMGISLVPIPLVDLIALTGIQLKMLHRLARLYRVPFSENLGKSLIVSLVGGVMPTSTAMTLASFAKAVPGLGTATGMVSVSILGGATTYAIGNVFIQHFEAGGTLLDFEPKKMRSYFANKLQEGKKVATTYKKKAEN